MRAAGLLLGLLVLAAAVIWVLPGLLDWSSYRATIAAYAANQLGRPVRIDGPISVTLLPAPLVTAGQVRLGDPGDGIALAAPTLRLRLAFAPLLLGRVAPRDLVLSGAVITLPWPLPPAALAQDRPDWLGGSAAHIEHGTLTVGALKLTDLDADLTAGDPETGGMMLDGSARLLNRRWRLTSRLGAPDAQGGAPVEATLEAEPGAPQEAGGRLAGTLARDGSFAGRLNARVADLSRLMPAPPMEAHLDGTVTLGHGPPDLDLTGNVGGTRMTARLASQVLSLRTGRLDLDAWQRALRARPARPGGGMIVLPWPISLDLQADAVTLRAGLITGLHAAIDLDADHGLLRAASAILPGNATVTASGTLTQPDPSAGLTLTGAATLDAPQLRTTLDWLRGCGLQIGAVLPPDVLRTAQLRAHIQASRDQVALTGLNGHIEDSTVTGSLAVETASGAIDADLTLDHLAADHWLPDDSAKLDWPTLSHDLAGFAVHLTLHAATVPLRGMLFQNLDLDAATNEGGLAVDHAAFDLDGLHGVLAGTLAGDGQLTDGRIDLGAPSATGFAQHLPPWAKFTDFLWAGPLRLHAEATGPLDALIASVGVDLADARLEAHPVIDLTDGSWTAQMTLRHPGAPRLLGLLGYPQARDWLGEGSLSLLAHLSSAAGVWQADSFDLTAATLHASGDLKLDRTATPPLLTGHVAADTLPLPPFMPGSHDPMPWAVLGGWAASVDLASASVLVGDTELLRGVQAKLNLAGGVLTVDHVKATLGGGALTGKAVFDSQSAPPRLAVDAALAAGAIGGPVFGTPIDLSAGRVDGALSLTGRGYSPAAILASMAGTLKLQLAGGTLAGIDLKSPMDASGAARFDLLGIDASAAGGMLTLNQLTLAGPDGAAMASGTIDLSDHTLSLLAHLPGAADLRLSGTAAAPRRVLEDGAVAALPSR
jgi:hypothetical protein